MNKFEFQRRLEEGEELIADGKFEEAVEVLDQLDLAMIDQPRRLQNIAKAYEKAKRYEDAEDILLDAREFAPKSRAITFHLCTVALKAGELKEAKEYYEDFLKIGARDPQRFVLQYRIAEAEKRPDEDLMEILETYRKEEPDDRWMFQLASLYAQHGMYEKAVDVCNSIDLWFFNGKYVKMARELREQLGAQGPDYSKQLEEIREEERRAAEERAAEEERNRSPYSAPAEQNEAPAAWMDRAAAAADGAEEAVKTAADETEEIVKTVADEAEETVATVADEAEETVKAVADEAEEAVTTVADEAEEAVTTVADETEESAETVRQAAKTVRTGAVVEEEDEMFDFSYSLEGSQPVKVPVVPLVQKADEEDKPPFTIHFSLPKQEEPEEEDRHVVFNVTGRKPAETVADEAEDLAREAGKAVSAAADEAEDFTEDVKDFAEDVKDTAEAVKDEADDFSFDFDPSFGFDDEDADDEDDEDDSFGKRPAFVAPKPEPKKPARKQDDEDDNDDEFDEEDDEDEDDEPAKKKEKKGLKALFGWRRKDESYRFEEDDEDDEDEEDGEEKKREVPEDADEESAEKKSGEPEDEGEARIAGDAEEEKEKEPEPDLETLALQAAIRRREEDSRLFGGLPIDPDVGKDVWHFLVHGKTPELSLECAREKLRELMEANPNCPTKMLKISAEKIGNANIINSLDRFLNNMVIVEGAGKLSDKQLSDFAKVLNKDDRALLLVFTDTKEELAKMFTREPALKDSFTAVFEGRRFSASDLMQVAKTYLYQEDAKLTESGEAYLADYITRLLAEGKGFYRTNVISLTEDALEISEKGGFLGLAMGKVDANGFLSVTGKHFRKAENLG